MLLGITWTLLGSIVSICVYKLFVILLIGYTSVHTTSVCSGRRILPLSFLLSFL